MGQLSGIETVLLDLDGTLYVGSQVVPGAREPVRRLLAGCLAGPEEPATHVLVADPSYGAAYDDLDAAFRALRAGAELVATQVNRIPRRDDGEHLDTGGWVRLLEYATGQTARVLGKPSPEFFTAPLEALGRGAGTALVVGDDLTADVGGGRAVGAGTVLVRSGKGDHPQPGAEAKPDAVVDSVADLPGLLQG